MRLSATQVASAIVMQPTKRQRKARGTDTLEKAACA